MSNRIKLVQNDTLPAVVVQLTDCRTGNPIDISQAVVTMLFRAVGTTVTLDTLIGVLLTGFDEGDAGIVTTSPYNVAGVGGRVQFNWKPTTLAVTPGLYEGEIIINFTQSSTTQTVFDTVKFFVRAA